MKLTNEAPKGLKSNMLKSFMDLTNERMAISHQQDNYFKLTFALSLFHALIQERRKFGPIGWNIKYEVKSMNFKVQRQRLGDLFDGVEVPAGVLARRSVGSPAVRHGHDKLRREGHGRVGQEESGLQSKQDLLREYLAGQVPVFTVGNILFA